MAFLINNVYKNCNFAGKLTLYVKTGIPNTLATRLNVIVIDENTLKNWYQGLKDDLLKGGYPDRVIDLRISIASAKCRPNLLNPTRNDIIRSKSADCDHV